MPVHVSNSKSLHMRAGQISPDVGCKRGMLAAPHVSTNQPMQSFGLRTRERAVHQMPQQTADEQSPHPQRYQLKTYIPCHFAYVAMPTLPMLPCSLNSKHTFLATLSMLLCPQDPGVQPRALPCACDGVSQWYQREGGFTPEGGVHPASAVKGQGRVGRSQGESRRGDGGAFCCLLYWEEHQAACLLLVCLF